MLKSFFLVMKAELVRTWIVMRRYWFRTLTGMAISYGMLLVLVLGFMQSRESVGEEVSNRLGDATSATNFILGFIIGMFAFSIVGMFSSGLQGMARTGVLEQLCMSPHGLVVNFLARSFVAAVSLMISSSVLVYLLTSTPQVGGTLHFSALPTMALLFLTFVNLLGFGFMIGGLTLVFKEIGQIALILRMVLFGLAIFAKEELYEQGVVLSVIMHALPITDAAICLKAVLVKGVGMDVFAHPSFYFLLVSCGVWMVTGILCFRYMENWSRYKGTLGAY